MTRVLILFHHYKTPSHRRIKILAFSRYITFIDQMTVCPALPYRFSFRWEHCWNNRNCPGESHGLLRVCIRRLFVRNSLADSFTICSFIWETETNTSKYLLCRSCWYNSESAIRENMGKSHKNTHTQMQLYIWLLLSLLKWFYYQKPLWEKQKWRHHGQWTTSANQRAVSQKTASSWV